MRFDTLFVGLGVAMAFRELVGIFPGGIVVPAFLSLYADQPARLAATAAASTLGLLVYRVLSRNMISFGSRRFFLIVSITAAVVLGAEAAIPRLAPASIDARVAGIVVPGLLADACERQGYAVTVASTCIAVSIVTLAVRLIASL